MASRDPYLLGRWKQKLQSVRDERSRLILSIELGAFFVPRSVFICNLKLTGTFEWIMDGLVGLLKVRVVRGINLAYRDARGSDPYVVLRLGKKVVFFIFFFVFGTAANFISV